MTKKNEPLYVTRPSLPPLEEFIPYLERIWQSHCLTNNGPFHQELEETLARYLGVKRICLFTNGTLALLTALQALRITGEVITTPYSFVATTHALWWNGIKPVFVDIEPKCMNLDPERIEAAITPQTTAILPVHVYGNPCRVKEIQEIADTYGLKVIYDAAHAFGVTVNGQSVLNFGDLSVLSFHATKAYTTFEGGAIVCHDEATKKRIDFLKNFGFADETTVVAPGINAKMNEFQSALGLLQLRYVEEGIEKRKRVSQCYRERLRGTQGITLMEDVPEVGHCYPYFPILIDKEEYGKSRDQVYEELKNSNVFCRKYFYPLISQFPSYRGLESARPGRMPIAESVTERIICLPIYSDLDMKAAESIANIIRR